MLMKTRKHENTDIDIFVFGKGEVPVLQELEDVFCGGVEFVEVVVAACVGEACSWGLVDWNRD